MPPLVSGCQPRCQSSQQAQDNITLHLTRCQARIGPLNIPRCFGRSRGMMHIEHEWTANARPCVRQAGAKRGPQTAPCGVAGPLANTLQTWLWCWRGPAVCGVRRPTASLLRCSPAARPASQTPGPAQRWPDLRRSTMYAGLLVWKYRCTHIAFFSLSFQLLLSCTQLLASGPSFPALRGADGCMPAGGTSSGAGAQPARA